MYRVFIVLHEKKKKMCPQKQNKNVFNLLQSCSLLRSEPCFCCGSHGSCECTVLPRSLPEWKPLPSLPEEHPSLQTSRSDPPKASWPMSWTWTTTSGCNAILVVEEPTTMPLEPQPERAPYLGADHRVVTCSLSDQQALRALRRQCPTTAAQIKPSHHA